MGLTVNAFEFLKPEPAEVYQEAALSLRYKRITAITAAKLQRAIKLLQLEPHHLVMRGLASRRSLVKGLDWSGKQQGRQKTFLVPANFGNSVTTEAFPPQRDQNGKIEEKNDDQNDGWSDYEDNYDSDSDIDDDEDKDDEIEGRRKGPIYDFLVYGGVQLRPDEYILLFRALGLGPQYVEQLQRKADMKTRATPSCSFHVLHPHSAGATRLGGVMIEEKAPCSQKTELYTSNPIGECQHSHHWRGKSGIGSSIGNSTQTSVSDSKLSVEDLHRPPPHNDASNVDYRGDDHGRVFQHTSKHSATVAGHYGAI